jgi:hypothetical protein
MSLTSVAIAAGPAAAKTPKPGGADICHVGGTMNFNPPLTTGNGTPVVRDEIVLLNLTLSGCGGVSSPDGLAPTAASSVDKKRMRF